MELDEKRPGETEKDAENITEAILRYDIEHPVINDSGLQMWNLFQVRAWPTVILIDPEGKAVWGQSGEITMEQVREVLDKAIPYYRRHGLLDERPLRLQNEASKVEATPLRFPGKVLAPDPDGKPLLQYVYEAACACPLVGPVVVATDDDRVREAVERFGGKVCMTAPHHQCGSERSAEVAEDLENPVIVNLQADEPGILPEMIGQTIELLESDADCAMSTLAARIDDPKDLADPNVVKVVVDAAWRALYFSRSPIPFGRDPQIPFDTYKHLGFYAYTRRFLDTFRTLSEGALEKIEKLEQLRAIEYGYRIKVVVTEYDSPEVDLPEDIDRMEKILGNH